MLVNSNIFLSGAIKTEPQINADHQIVSLYHRARHAQDRTTPAKTGTIRRLTQITQITLGGGSTRRGKGERVAYESFVSLPGRINARTKTKSA